jgi:hypothetical protein
MYCGFSSDIFPRGTGISAYALDYRTAASPKDFQSMLRGFTFETLFVRLTGIG